MQVVDCIGQGRQTALATPVQLHFLFMSPSCSSTQVRGEGGALLQAAAQGPSFLPAPMHHHSRNRSERVEDPAWGIF